MWGSTSVPAATSNSGVSTITPVISRIARRAIGRSTIAPRTVAYRHTAMEALATMVLVKWTSRTMKVATNRNGIVTMSTDAVTIGVETASRS